MYESIHKYMVFSLNVDIQCQAWNPIPNCVFYAPMQCSLGMQYIFGLESQSFKLNSIHKIKMLHFDIHRVIKPVGEAKIP